MKKELGLVHIYCGDGKGKTTAAMGLVLRAVANDYNVVIVQFLKNGSSGEISILKSFPKVRFFANSALKGFSFAMNEEEKALSEQNHRAYFKEAVSLCKDGSCDVLVLDEVIYAVNNGLFPKELLMDFLKDRPEHVEIIMTGRKPPQELIELADYVSEIHKVKHPYDKGIPARTGIEK